MGSNRWIVAALVLALWIPSAIAEEPRTPQDVFAKSVESMAAMAKNARIKLKNGVGAFGAGGRQAYGGTDEDLSRGGRIGEAGSAEPEVGQGKPSACCAMNLTELRKGIAAMDAVIQEYGRRLQGNEAAKPELATMRAYLDAMEGALQVFRASDSVAIAEDAIGSFLDGLNQINQTHDRLIACCLSAPRTNQQRS